VARWGISVTRPVLFTLNPYWNWKVLANALLNKTAWLGWRIDRSCDVGCARSCDGQELCDDLGPPVIFATRSRATRGRENMAKKSKRNMLRMEMCVMRNNNQVSYIVGSKALLSKRF
jgi:hypothetical protein